MILDSEKTEEEIVDNYRTDTLYTHKFKSDEGKYFRFVSKDEKKELLTIREAAQIFGVHIETFRRWDSDDKLSAVRVGDRGHRRYKREEIAALLN